MEVETIAARDMNVPPVATANGKTGGRTHDIQGLNSLWTTQAPSPSAEYSADFLRTVLDFVLTNVQPAAPQASLQAPWSRLVRCERGV